MLNANYIGTHALLNSDKAAVINASSGEILSYRELDERSNRFARYLQAQGLQRGDTFAVFLENNIRYFELCWAALRSELLVVPINRFLTAGEAAYIAQDSGAKVVASSWALRNTAQALPALLPGCEHLLMLAGCIDGWDSYEETVAPSSPRPWPRIGWAA
ncbi:Long-chain-fatty-acid--CoA ligase [compost metagenome]